MADKSNKKIKFSGFPSINSILEDKRLGPLIEKWSFPFVSSEVKSAAARMKKSALKVKTIPGTDDIITEIKGLFAQYENDLIKPVINGTGVVLHTNLGRAPVDPGYYQQMKDIACGYSNLEFDIKSDSK